MERLKEQLLEFDTVIWDWNGTLLDDAHLCVEIVNGILHRYNLPSLSLTEYRRKFDFPVRKYYDSIGLTEDRVAFDVVSEEFVSTYRTRFPEVELHRGTVQLLQDLQAAEVSQAVLSASHKTELAIQIASHGLESYFGWVQGLDDILAAGKVEAGRTLLKKSGVDPGKAVLVGDTLHDLEVGRALGLKQVLLLDHGHHCSERLSREHTHVIRLRS